MGKQGCSTPFRHVEPVTIPDSTNVMPFLVAPEPEFEEEGLTGPLSVRLGVEEDRLRGALDRLPPKERDILDLAVRGKTQTDIAEVMGGTSQSSISYKIGRAIQRLRFWLSVPVVTEREIRSAFEKVVHRRKEGRYTWGSRIDILVAFHKETGQLATAQATGATYSRVRHVLIVETAKLVARAEQDESVRDVAQWFSAVVGGRHWNVAREQTRSPEWIANLSHRMKKRYADKKDGGPTL
jgi:hypothetical protein